MPKMAVLRAMRADADGVTGPAARTPPGPETNAVSAGAVLPRRGSGRAHVRFPAARRRALRSANRA